MLKSFDKIGNNLRYFREWWLWRYDGKTYSTTPEFMTAHDFAVFFIATKELHMQFMYIIFILLLTTYAA